MQDSFSVQSCPFASNLGPALLCTRLFLQVTHFYKLSSGLFALACIGRALDFAFVKDGRRKIGEVKIGEDETPAISKKDVSDSDDESTSNEVPSAKRPLASYLPVWFEDSMEVLHALRGIGWDYGKGAYVPPETRPLERGSFLLATLVSFQRNFFIVDFLESILKLVPGVGSPMGGSMFFQNIPPFSRYVVSTAIHLATGTAFIAGFSMVYDLTTLLCVGLLRHEPSSWPPILDNPWISHSLHEFWAKRWHQLLRQTFLVFGGYPGQFLFGKLGLVVGTFIASGLYHECAMYAMGRGWDWRVITFFAFQGVAVILERVWRVVTGRRVGGWPGRIWVYFCIFVMGQQCGKPSSKCLSSGLLTWSRSGLLASKRIGGWHDHTSTYKPHPQYTLPSHP